MSPVFELVGVVVLFVLYAACAVVGVIYVRSLDGMDDQ